MARKKKYEPKVGEPIEIGEAASIHQRKMEITVLIVGIIIVFVYLGLIVFKVPIANEHRVALSAILAVGLAAFSLGLVGSLSVTFQKSGLVAKGTLGFGVFVLVFLVSTFFGCRSC